MATSNDLDLAMAEHLRELYTSGENADIVIKAQGGKELKVHKIVISRCKFFHGCCNRAFKEAETGVIEMPEDDDYAVETLIRHLYGWAFPEVETILSFKNPAMTILAIYSTADKYGMTDLATATLSAFVLALQKLNLADQQQLSVIVDLLYNSAHPKADEFRRILVKNATTVHRAQFQEGRTSPDWMKDIFIDSPGFGYDLYIGMIGEGQIPVAKAGWGLKCDYCDFCTSSRGCNEGSMCPNCGNGILLN